MESHQDLIKAQGYAENSLKNHALDNTILSDSGLKPGKTFSGLKALDPLNFSVLL